MWGNPGQGRMMEYRKWRFEKRVQFLNHSCGQNADPESTRASPRSWLRVAHSSPCITSRELPKARGRQRRREPVWLGVRDLPGKHDEATVPGTRSPRKEGDVRRNPRRCWEGMRTRRRSREERGESREIRVWWPQWGRKHTFRGLMGPESPGVGAGRTEEKGARQEEP